MLTSDQNRKINEIVEEFKEAADFYRMEYSEDLMGMFRDFGCMLLLKCKVDTEGKADLERLLEGRHKLKGTVKRQLMTVSEELAQLWEPGEQDGSGDTGEYEGSQNVREMFQTALEEIFHFCLYSKGGKNRYLLPEETAKPLLRLITLPEGMMAGNEGLVVLDTQCGAGSVLMAASRYLKNPRLMGYEKEEMWAAAVIMSQLSGLEMELHLEDGARADLYESCDLVISNPVYGTDTIKDEELIDQLPGELKTVRGRYHMELIRSMQALNFDGKAMLIVPNSFLFANRTESMKVRKWLLQSYSLEASFHCRRILSCTAVSAPVSWCSVSRLCPAAGKDIPRECCIIIWKSRKIRKSSRKNMNVWKRYGARETVIMENGSAPAGKKRWKTATV